MPASAHDVAAYILKNGGRMSVMKLQKLVYYSQAWHLVWEDKRLFSDRIEAWANGPVVPNLYPAFERQEVVIHSPEHIRSFAQLDDDQIGLIAQAWLERRATEPRGELLAIVNEGRLAGASLPHSHSQLIWIDEQPPAIAAEHPERLPELLADELERRGGVIAAVHPVGAGPYECLIGPVDEEGSLADGLVLLRDLVRRLHDAEGVRPWNAWFHPGPPWHLHFVPRLTALAAIELGAGIVINVLPPSEAEDRLRRSPR